MRKRVLVMKALFGFYMAIPISMLAFNAQAADSAHSMGQGSSWFYMEQSNGVITNIPAAGNQELIESVKGLQHTLVDRKEQLAIKVQDTKLKPKDAWITAIMPGGLLYASYKIASYNHAKSELAHMEYRIEELTQDVVRLTDVGDGSRVAMLY
jgi:hypothetical protein